MSEPASAKVPMGLHGQQGEDRGNGRCAGLNLRASELRSAARNARCARRAGQTERWPGRRQSCADEHAPASPSSARRRNVLAEQDQSRGSVHDRELAHQHGSVGESVRTVMSQLAMTRSRQKALTIVLGVTDMTRTRPSLCGIVIVARLTTAPASTPWTFQFCRSDEHLSTHAHLDVVRKRRAVDGRDRAVGRDGRSEEQCGLPAGTVSRADSARRTLRTGRRSQRRCCASGRCR